MKIIYCCFLTVMVLGGSSLVNAQISYNKRALGNIGTVPNAADYLNSASLDHVDMTTGTLKIGIPLYEIKVNDISVPIMLNYNALGLKVGQEAGAPGMGWELSAGGKIVMNIQGKNDQSNYGMYGQQALPNVLQLQPYTNTDHKQIVTDILDGKRDSGWDTFNYILPNGGGTFTRNGLTFPYDPLITIGEESITTTDGLVYNFTGGDYKKSSKLRYYDIIETTPQFIGNGHLDSPVEWSDRDLQNICSVKFKDTVHFKYENFHTGIPAHRPILGAKTRMSTTETLPLYRNVSPVFPTDNNIDFGYDDRKYNALQPIISQTVTEYVQHSRIQEIQFPNGKVRFEYYPDILGRDVLAFVNIFRKVDNDYVVLKKYQFEYENNTSYGHYLKSIHIRNAKDIRQNSWDFTYNEQLPIAPNTEGKAQDRWGFYNGQTDNKTLLEDPDSVIALRNRRHYPIFDRFGFSTGKHIGYTRSEAKEFYGTSPTTNVVEGRHEYIIPFADRRVDFNMAKKGTLKAIKTPTGGKFSYEYEPHKTTFPFYFGTDNLGYDEQRLGGGIRVKSIVREAGGDSLTFYGLSSGERYFRKTYVYGNARYSDYNSHAKLSSGLATVTIPGNVVMNRSEYYNPLNLGNRPVIMNIMLLSHPINSLVQYGGSYALYESVSEFLMQGPTGSRSYGKTVQYNNRIPFENAPDNKWMYAQSGGLENPGLPYFIANPGVSRENVIAAYGIKKFAYKDDVYYPVEETEYRYSTFEAPRNSANSRISFFGSLTGQMMGAYPQTSGGPIVDNPWETLIGGAKFNSTVVMGDHGDMDYITRTMLMEEGKTIDYQNKYATELVDLNHLSNCIRLREQETHISDGEGYHVSKKIDTYTYQNPQHLLVTAKSSLSSDGQKEVKYFFYAQDLPASSAVINHIKNTRIGLADPIEETTTFTRMGYDGSYEDQSTITTFDLFNDVALPSAVYDKPADGDDNGYNGSNWALGTSSFRKAMSYDGYVSGNVHKYTNLKGTGNVVMWGYQNQYPIAKVNNTSNSLSGRSTDVAYTSFENKDLWSNWAYSGTVRSDESSPSGKKVYELTSGPVTKINLTSSGKYILSYWYKSGSTVFVSGGNVSTPVIKNRYRNWTLVEHEISGSISGVSISGSGLIDEVRFHPIDSQMTTYLYEPLVGISGVIDANGRPQFYRYDDSQRLKSIQDYKGNLIKSYKYVTGLEYLQQ